jgi:hypothetical protein
VGVDDLELIGTQLPAGELALFLAARSRTRIPFGAGLRCVAGPGLMRLGAPHSTGPEGIVRTGPGIATAMEAAGSMGADLIGAAWHFQVWYRDSESSCEGGFNLTNGYTVTFKP